MAQFRPMLAATLEDPSSLSKVALVSPKIDGIRCLVLSGQAVSRALKPIQNARMRELLSRPELDGLDGELVAGASTSESAFNQTTRAVMGRKADSSDVVYQVFDDMSQAHLPFTSRLERAKEKVAYAQSLGLPLQVVPQVRVDQPRQLDSVYQIFLRQGYEGAMLRDPHAPYKHGRSTVREGWLLKLKPFADAEAEVVGYEELFRNLNEAEVSELGYTKRSSAKAGKVPAGTLGALRVRDLQTGITFSLGGGFTQEDRDALWSLGDALLGRIVTYKSCVIGVVDAPRFPVWKGFRDTADVTYPRGVSE